MSGKLGNVMSGKLGKLGNVISGNSILPKLPKNSPISFLKINNVVTIVIIIPIAASAPGLFKNPPAAPPAADPAIPAARFATKLFHPRTKDNQLILIFLLDQ